MWTAYTRCCLLIPVSFFPAGLSGSISPDNLTGDKAQKKKKENTTSSDELSDVESAKDTPPTIRLSTSEPRAPGTHAIEVRGTRRTNGLFFRRSDVALALDMTENAIRKLITGPQSMNDMLQVAFKIHDGTQSNLSPHGGQIGFLELSGKTFAAKLPCEWGAATIVGSEEEDTLYGLQQEAFAAAEVRQDEAEPPSPPLLTCAETSVGSFRYPGIYFLLVGKLGDMRTSMGLANAELDNWLVVKAGKAVDLNDGLPDHRREVENYQGATLTVKGLMVTERSELTTAENTIHAWLHGAGEKVEPEARKQLKDGSTKDVHKKWSEIFELRRTQHPPAAVSPHTPADRYLARDIAAFSMEKGSYITTPSL
ncbi:hypothetical protein BDZ88DRAFT_454533 [Geranomyces variabilis]|nr:hypothetical protein BDZ88DRAFT_454533 [Geranomyces variabilis]KAJ3134322.1 hypothetical protein HDU90_005188 [Geranomyces variabilis]